MIESLDLRRLQILLDEWSAIPLDLQPYLAEFLRKIFFANPKVTLKLGTLEFRSNFSHSTELGQLLRGLELSSDTSPAFVGFKCRAGQPVRLSVVIPTVDGCRHGYLSQLISQIGSQDCTDFEVLVVRGDPRQGRAINVGAALAQGKYLLTLDDDTCLPDPATFGKLMAVMDAHPDIGMAGGSNLVPKDAPAFVRRVMKELPADHGPWWKKSRIRTWPNIPA